MGGEGTNTQKVKLVLTNAEYLSIVKLLTVGCFVVVICHYTLMEVMLFSTKIFTFCRISQLASERLRDANTVMLDDITSTKHVANRFTELYSQEWSLAYEELNKANRDGSDTIQHLLRIIQVRNYNDQ